MYTRELLSSLKNHFFEGKAIILTGARQVGKTTLVSLLLEQFSDSNSIRIFNCDNPTDRAYLEDQDLEALRLSVGDADILFIDEAQKVNNIGQTLKLLVDAYTDKIQIIATGSSRMHLLNHTQEALTGRKIVFTLYPLSVSEVIPDHNPLILTKRLEEFLLYGLYPEVVSRSSREKKIELLEKLQGSTLFRDIFDFQLVKNSSSIRSLVKALALQIGSQVSYHELGRMLGMHAQTVKRYIDLLEANHVLFRLPPYAANQRRVLVKMRKIFFYDLGIRNSIIGNFNLLDSRTDAGALFENFVIVERMKARMHGGLHAEQYFWRTYDGAEVDLVEERDGQLYGYECKWNENTAKKVKAPETWDAYADSHFEVVSPRTLPRFIW